MNYLAKLYNLMPPKKNSKSVAPKDTAPPKQDEKTQPKGKSLEKQKTLDNKVIEAELVKKNKSKQHVAGSVPTGKSSSDRWKAGDGKTPSKLTISSWNVNGIRSVLNKKDLQNYVAKLKPDMICINETKIDEKAYDSSPINL